MVDAVRAARWADWQRMAKELPDHHVLSVELLRTHSNETVIVLTVVRNGRVVQHELRANAKGQNPKPVITPRVSTGYDDPKGIEGAVPQIAAFAAMAAPAAGGEGGTAEDFAVGYPPPKEAPVPGVVALGSSLLETTFDLGEHAVDSTQTQ
jgi:hypothetical protein